jgi:hypothetical protein
MSPFFIFILYVAGLFIIGAAVFLFFLRKNIRERATLSQSLNLSLFIVRFAPQASRPDLTIQALREKISVMEQVYSSLYSSPVGAIKNFFFGSPSIAFEVAVPETGREIAFYVALPKRQSESLQKIIQGVFPEALVEPSADYNIFNPAGAAAITSFLLKEPAHFPIRTYLKMENDPLQSITNAFTKLSAEGEGAAVQIVIRPARKYWKNFIRAKAKEAFSGRGGKSQSGLGSVLETFNPPKEEKREEAKKLTPAEEEAVRAVEAKAAKALFEANIRIVSSAATKARAEEILRALAAPFSQFSDPVGNGFKAIEEKGRLQKDIIFDFSFRVFDERRLVVLNSEELTSILHFPNSPLETPHIKGIKAREAPPPANIPTQGLILGYNLFRGETREIKMMRDDRRRHFYIIGQTGTGKTTFLKNMIRQDIENGEGVCFIDPHGDTVEEILGLIPRHRLEDLIYFNPGDIARPMGLNMLEYDPEFPEQKTFIVNELFGIFQKLYGAIPEALGPMFEQYFRNATLLVMEDPQSGNTLLEISRVMSDKAFRDLKLSRAKNIVVKNFWTQIAEKAGGEGELRNMVPYITSKFDVFLANEIMRPIVAQEKSSFDFREIMDNQKIFLVNLSKGRLGDINSALIGLIIVGKLTMAALSRIDIREQEKRKDFYLYIDEFQNFTTDSIATILAEARKYRLNLSVAHQYIGQLSETIKKAVFGNVGSMASFRIGSDDGEFMEKQFAPVFKAHDLLNIDNYNCYVKLLIQGATSQPFSMKIYPPQKSDLELAETAKEISRLKYGRPREEVEREIEERQRY